ncbi:hypothetical protein KUTeg_016744 [Tegillarca granosa]|uniref:Carboxylesterase type B domain-containing protein n=1 Tax=Tegillarca granosa TaxID=220873 RepID=A0ABQ9ELR7_TEGGR|nr:hypothetical protein KUTeg_016744 [Tegillarca granosa]
MDLKENIIQCFYTIFFIVLVNDISILNCQEYVVRKFKQGKVRGLIDIVHSGKKVEKYFGIPYAKPPIGNRRFEPPEPVDPWGDSILNASELPPACPQPEEGLKYIENYVSRFSKSSEDCLYLNIYVPRNAVHHRIMPVLFFVHGGSYYTGMGAMFDGRALAVEEIVVVTMNYRLGPLGFLEAGDSNFPGNYGMLDQIAALKWVHENIEFFNGDPKRITLDGQSAGGCSVGLLMMSPLTQGMFRHVIMQSGSTLAHWAVTRTNKAPDIYFKAFTSEMGCLSNSTLQIKKCLQRVDGDRIQDLVYTGFGVSSSLSPHFRPVVDGYFLPNTPENLILSGDFDAKSVLIGSTRDEGLMAVKTLSTLCGNNSVPETQRFLTIMHCFKGDLPSIPDIVEKEILINASTALTYVIDCICTN